MAKKESKKVESPKPAEDRVKALETSISQINKTFGNGTIMYRRYTVECPCCLEL